MGIVRQLGANSAIYVATNLLQKGTTFLLMPLYTRYLDPTAYGVLAIVTAMNNLLSIAFTLGLTGAVTRFYFEYRDDPETLAEFWGSVLCLVIVLSVVMGTIVLTAGNTLLRPLIGGVPFWPYVALGVITTFFQPLFTTFLALLQTRNSSVRYAVVSLAYFLLNTLLTIALVVFLRWGVTGALVATLIASAVFFGLSLWLLRGEVRLCFKWQHLRPALSYGLPQVPHMLASQTTAMADRVILNSRLSTAAAGLYSVGAMISMVVDVAAQSVNRAFVPLSMAALKSGQARDLGHLRAVGSLILAAFCILGALIGAFSRELLWLLTSPAFAAAAGIVPLLVFAGVASALYYLFVNALFFDRSATKLLPLGTMGGAGMNVALALLLIPRFGLTGAAIASLTAQVCATILVAVIARRFDPVRWSYARYTAAFVVGLGCSLWLSTLDVTGVVFTIAVKLGGIMALCLLLGTILWDRPLILGDAALRLLQRRPAEAARLFVASEAAS